MGPKVAMVQMQGLATKEENVAKATKHIGVAVANGAQIVCLQELFNTIYFPYEANPEYYDFAEPIPGPTIDAMAGVPRSTGSYLSLRSTRRRWPASYTTPRRCWARRRHPGQVPQEQHPPSQDGNHLWLREILLQAGQHGLRGVPDAIRDQGWHPDLPRSQLPRGCPHSGASGRGHRPHAIRDWRRYPLPVEVLTRAHAMTNSYYVGSVNRVGPDIGGSPTQIYYGSSFFADFRGQIISQANDKEDEVIDAGAPFGGDGQRSQRMCRKQRPTS